MAQRRSIILINWKFQLKFCFYVVSWLLALSMIYPLIIDNLFDFFIRYASIDPMGPPPSELTKARNELLVLLVMMQLFFAGITFFISIFVSHRIAGPLFKLKNTFERAKNGDLDDSIRFRKYDYFPELAQGFNEMANSIKKKQLLHHEHAATAKNHLEQALLKLDHSQSEMREEIQSAMTSLNHISLPSE